MIPHLEVILKLSERCNIDCDYCYYFNSGSNHYSQRPALIGREVLEGLSNFLKIGYHDQVFSHAQIVMHGGEPLLLGKARFESLCEALHVAAPKGVLSLCLQTNAMLVDSEWVGIFERQKIRVSTSVDGPAKVHDFHRKDKRGGDTYNRTLRGIRLLQAAEKSGQIAPIGCLVVIDPRFSAGDVYAHIVEDLGFRSIDFLLPDFTHDSRPAAFAINAFSRYLCDLFDVWSQKDDPNVQLRFMKSVLALLISKRSYLAGFGTSAVPAITVGSDGAIDADDFLRPCGSDLISLGLNIRNTHPRDALIAQQRHLQNLRTEVVPKDCRDCTFVDFCRGGQATHRFSRDKQFDNPSIYCDSLYELFFRATRYLIGKNVPIFGQTATGSASSLSLGVEI
jgi:uncharacterized protein